MNTVAASDLTLLADQLVSSIDAQRHLGSGWRPILLVGHPGSGKSRTLRIVADRCAWPLVSVNTALAQALIGLPSADHPHKAADTLVEAARTAGGDAAALLLDNIELLFHKPLSLNPVQVLSRLARNRVVVAAWPGPHNDGVLTFAEPGHPDYRRLTADHAIVVTVPAI